MARAEINCVTLPDRPHQTDAARIELMPDRSSLWAGLFDLRENLLGRALDDLRVLTVA